VGLGAVLVAAPAGAQACLGLHATRAVPTVEVVSDFYRDGIAGPSTFGASLTVGGLFASVQTGANLAEGQSALLAGNGFAASAGAGMQLAGLDLCAGGSVARSETAGYTPTQANGLFGAAALPLAKYVGLPISAFGVAAFESRTSTLASDEELTDSGLAVRFGLSAYPKPWLGLRVYQDRVEEEQRLGFSVGLTFGLRPETK
jgi:hypothetical protein